MNSFILKFIHFFEDFPWKILHGRVKARPSSQSAPVTEDALRRFHHTKWVFLPYRAGKRLTAEARDKRIELCVERDAELKANQNKSVAHPSRQRIRDAWKSFIDSEKPNLLKKEAISTFPRYI